MTDTDEPQAREPFRGEIDMAARIKDGPPEAVIVRLDDGTNMFLHPSVWPDIRGMIEHESTYDLAGMREYPGVDGALYMIRPLDIKYAIFSTPATRKMGNVIQYLIEKDKNIAMSEMTQAETRLHAEAQGIPQADLDEHVQEIMQQRQQQSSGPRIFQP